MTESLIVRVKRIVSGNVMDVVDRMEKSQAEIVMKEAIREVARAVSDLRDEQGKVLLRASQAQKQTAAYTTKIADLDGKVELAVSQGRDDLAKAAISQQVDLEAQIKVLADAAAEAEAEQTKLTEYVVALQARQRDMEHELKTIASARAAAETAMPSTLNKNGPLARADNAAEVFKRAMVSGSHLTGIAEHSIDDAKKLHELEQLSHVDKIERRLQAAKAKQSA
jgi:phage shock protein A